MDVRWRIELLGGLRATQGGTEGEALGPVVTHFRSQKVASLLAYLAYHLQRAPLREQLIELLWPECEPHAGRNNLRQTLFALRRQFEPPGVPAGAVLTADRTSVRLNPEVVTTDVAEFEAALQSAARARSIAERAQHLIQAVELYRGELLAGYSQDWVLQEREWLAERYFPALRQLLALLEAAGDLDRALEVARRGVSADPLREEAHRELMRLHAAAGQPAAALRQYRELERLLRQELEATPDAATRTLVREIERLSVLLRAPLPRRGDRSADRGLPLDASASAQVLALPKAPTPAEGENRVVTVLFAEMSSSVETTGSLHPEDAAALLNRLLQAMVDAILKYEGRIDKLLGDGVLAVFGVPHAHEDDPERAIRAALEIREAVQKQGLEVTAGIHTGEVYVGAVGSERYQEKTVAGPIVNLASRLQKQAQPGQILAGEATYRQTRRAFELSPLSLEIKEIARPVVAYTVERAVPRPEKARGIEGLRARLIGRAEELAKLQAALAEVLQGRGQIVTLVGEAGLGKSRLVAELKQVVLSSADDRPAPLWLEGRCLELGMTASYSLFVDLFRDYFRWRADEDDPARSERLVACLRGFVARQDLSAERVEEMGPLLGNLLSLHFGTDWDLRLRNASPEQIKHQTFLAIRDVFVALARRQPVILVCEDLHWADSLSLDLISLLMESVTLAPLLLVCVYRPEREHKCGRLGSIAAQKCAERYTEIYLRELTPPQSRRLVESLLTIADLPASVEALILERSRGNPFFVEEVVRALIDAGMVYRQGEVWRAREEIVSVAVPESVQSVIFSRVDRLGSELKDLLQRASVIGRLFRRRLLGELTPPELGLEQALWELEERALIYQERVVPEEEYSFKHVLTQETIYRSLLRRQRARLHQQVGEAMEALYAAELDAYTEPLAYHYERSGADEKAVEYLLKAGEKSRRAYLNEVAIGYFERALERLDETPVGEARKDWRLEALKGLGLTYQGIGKDAEAMEPFRQAIALGQEMGLAPRELVRLYYWLAEVVGWATGRSDERIRIGEEGLALLGQDTVCVEAALMNSRVAIGHLNYWKGDREKWRELTYRNAQFLERLPYSEELRAPYTHVILVYADDKNVEEAKKWLQALERKAQQHHDLQASASVHHYAGEHLLAPQGDLRGAIAQYQGALALFTQIGDAKGASWVLGLMAEAFLSLGDLQSAEECACRELELAESVANAWRIGWAYWTLGATALCHASWESATDAFEKARRMRGRGAEGAWVASCLGRAYLARGQRREALRQFQEAITLADFDTLFAPRAFRFGGHVFLGIVSGLEEAEEDPEAFRAFCRRFRHEHPEYGDIPCVQWFLEPTEPSGVEQPEEAAAAFQEDFAGPLAPDWVWQDPFGDGSFTVRDGLELHAANGRDLWYLNLSAPRLLRSASGSFAVQTVCLPASAERPAIGGLLLWRDRENFLRLDRGTAGEHEIAFMGCLGNKDHLFGRGRLASEQVLLRLERLGRRVNALCSADGNAWLTVGHVDFPVEDPVQVGLHAIGRIDRTIYHGAYPEGTAIRFASFQMTPLFPR